MNVDFTKCDILIIGGGLAGLMAALESSNICNNVVILSKVKLVNLVAVLSLRVVFQLLLRIIDVAILPIYT